MADVIYVNFYSGTTTLGGNWNESNDPTTTGTMIADLVDFNTGLATGRSLTLNSAFTGTTGSDGTATSGAGGLPEGFFDRYFYDGADTASVTVSATNGESYTLKVAGHQGTTAARDTNFSATGAASNPYLYDNSGTATPTEPVTITGTVTGGGVTISQALVSSYAYINGFTIEFAAASIDTADTPITDGEQDNAFTVSGFGSAISSAKLVDVATGNYEYDASASLAGTYTYDYQDVANLTSDTLGTPFDSASHTHNLSVSDGTDTATTAVVINPATGWAVVEVASAVKTEGSVFENFVGTILDTCQVLYPTANNTSVSATGILTTDQLVGSISMVFYDISDYKWKPFRVIVKAGTGIINFLSLSAKELHSGLDSGLHE